ncbi:MAG: cellobiose 2-epimerase [Anaerolineales bacterium]
MTYRSDLSPRLRAELTENILPFWMKYAPDPEHGGFHGAISNTLEVFPAAPRSAILCARILWTFSTTCRVFGAPEYRQMADYAYQTLTGSFWDADFGGVYWSLNPGGAPLEPRKHHYAQAFAIYGLSEYFRATQNKDAKKLAVVLFDLLEQHAFEPVYGGYTEGSSREWGALADMRLSDKEINCSKSMNTMLHILEAYTNLLRIWDDPRLRRQHRALLETYLEKVYDPQTGHLRLFFDNAWNALEAHDSYGHDIEASWLMWEAAQMHPDPALHERIRPAVLGLAESVYREGRDTDGSLFYEGLSGEILVEEKHWWPQAEALVGFTNAYELSGNSKFAAAVGEAWKFIENHMIDRVYGDWFKETDRAGNPKPGHMKAGFWDCPYHHARACFEILERSANL